MHLTIQDLILKVFRVFLFFGFAVIKLLYHFYLILYPYLPSFQLSTPQLFHKSIDNIVSIIQLIFNMILT